jgi:hypothetical protein
MLKTANDPRALLCDFDFARGPSLRPMWVTLRTCALRPRFIEYARTRRGWHVVIGLREPLQPAEQVALQAVLGSDRRREGLNIFRVLSMRRKGASDFWQARWNLLFKGKLS